MAKMYCFPELYGPELPPELIKERRRKIEEEIQKIIEESDRECEKMFAYESSDNPFERLQWEQWNNELHEELKQMAESKKKRRDLRAEFLDRYYLLGDED